MEGNRHRSGELPSEFSLAVVIPSTNASAYTECKPVSGGAIGADNIATMLCNTVDHTTFAVATPGDVNTESFASRELSVKKLLNPSCNNQQLIPAELQARVVEIRNESERT